MCVRGVWDASIDPHTCACMVCESEPYRINMHDCDCVLVLAGSADRSSGGAGEGQEHSRGTRKGGGGQRWGHIHKRGLEGGAARWWLLLVCDVCVRQRLYENAEAEGSNSGSFGVGGLKGGGGGGGKGAGVGEGFLGGGDGCIEFLECVLPASVALVLAVLLPEIEPVVRLHGQVMETHQVPQYCVCVCVCVCMCVSPRTEAHPTRRINTPPPKLYTRYYRHAPIQAISRRTYTHIRHPIL